MPLKTEGDVAPASPVHVPALSVSSDAARGLSLGLLAATSYSVANLALRHLATGDGGLAWDVWISGMKALPTAVVAGWLLVMRWRRGELVIPPWRLVGPLILAALVMQFGGNVGFQVALRAIGLAISVPLVFSSIIVSGALVGRMALGDQVTPRTAISMALMVVSIVFLSAAAHSTPPGGNAIPLVLPAAAEVDVPAAATVVSSQVPVGATMGLLIAVVSGLSYGLCGVVIRRVVRGSLPVATTLFIFSVTGLVALCPLSAGSLGWDALRQISTTEWVMMLTAGSFNAMGFFAITHALRLLTISRANVVNASQNAMCAVGAVVFFAEPMSAAALAGIGLTILGLLTLDRK